MEKLPMCRICLGENVNMYVVVNRNLHKLYEKLTDIPFVTEDRRPIFACFVCCVKLKQCYRLLRKCLKAEELLAQMMNEDYEPELLNQDHGFFSSFIQSPIMHISVVDECQTESIAIKEVVPAVCEGLDDIIDPKEEPQSEELELENLENSCLDVADIPPHHSESDLEDGVLVMKFETEVEEEQDASKMKRRAREMTRATVVKKPKLEDAITAEQTSKEKSHTKVTRINQKRTSEPGTYSKEPYKCDQRSFNPVKITQIGKKPYKCDVCHHSFSKKCNLNYHIRKHTGEKPNKCDVCQRSFSQRSALSRHILIHTGEKPYKCDVCQRSFRIKYQLLRHIRMHTEKPFMCDICQHSFRQKSSLTEHILKHLGGKPYKCDVCQSSFSQKVDLARHIQIHTGKKPYTCDVCQSGFTQKVNLKRHFATYSHA